MAEPVLDRQGPEQLYHQLMESSQGYPVEDTLARMIASWQYRVGALPDRLGLSEEDFTLMIQRHFPNFDSQSLTCFGSANDPQRFDEIDDLYRLLLQNRTGTDDAELWMADILIAGCLGSDHLWQDLGLWQRADLSKLMLMNFEPLAKRNDKDMKWKKFLYKQLCETEGIYTCRAPSCEVCTDYDKCFGPED